MKQNELISYAYDFISQLFENKTILEKTRKIILFGSIARGDFTKESDVDLFIDTNNKNLNETNETIKKEINKFEAMAEKTWHLRGIKLQIKVLAGDLNEEKWKDLREEILAYGKILYGKFEQSPSDLKHRLLIVYDIKKIEQKKKMSLLRKLYGYKIKKGKKSYAQKGIIEETESKRRGSNSFAINPENLIKIKQLFKSHNTPYQIFDYWTI